MHACSDSHSSRLPIPIDGNCRSGERPAFARIASAGRPLHNTYRENKECNGRLIPPKDGQARRWRKFLLHCEWIHIAGLACLCLLTGCYRAPEPVPGSTGDHAPRVVSLAPSLTEIICALGAEQQLIGRTSACDYPPDKIKAIPVIGGFGAPSLDLLLKIQPTLVLDVDLRDASVGKMIDQIGLQHQRIACSTVDDIPRAITQVGHLLHATASACALADPICRRIVALRREAERRQASGQPLPSIFVEIWDSPLTTVGKDSFISDLISLAGGRNLGDEVAHKDYFSVSSEWVIARDPDVILCLYMTKNRETRGLPAVARPAQRSLGEVGSEGTARADSQLTAAWSRVAARTGWVGIKAVKNHRVYGELDDSVILRPGPRILEGIEALRQCILLPAGT